MASPSSIIQQVFPHQPTPGQAALFALFDPFLDRQAPERSTLLLRGYAGTGKTSVVSALVEALARMRQKYVLMAPTGRAAKVLGQYSGRLALTIHKNIYRPRTGPGGEPGFKLQENFYSYTVFVVDEASMLADTDVPGQNGLLSDVIEFVFSRPGNRLLLIGDGAQLPPVGSPESPALNPAFLKERYGLHVLTTELTEVMRQDQNSGILFNATQLRQQLALPAPKIFFRTSAYKDIYKMTGERLQDGLQYAYDKYGTEGAIVVTRSNKAAVQYNEYIRRNLHWREHELEAGDLLMIVRNNYHWLPDDAKTAFLANGDFAEVAKIVSTEEEEYDFRFADVELSLPDYPDQPPFSVKLLLDTLHADSPSLTRQEYVKLYEGVAATYADITNKRERQKAIREDPHMNALQVKFAYALTCHKSQGGQWPAVFVDQGYITEEQVNTEYLRWLYTAITRASKELFLLNFHKSFFSPAAGAAN